MKRFFIEKVTVVMLLVFALATGAASCKKQSDCPDAAYYANLKNNKPTIEEWLKDNPQFALKSAAENDCDDQRIAVEEGAADSTKYGDNTRAGFLAMPDSITTDPGWYYWRDFNSSSLPKDNLVDSIILHREITEEWWFLLGEPLPWEDGRIDSIFRALYNDGGIYLTQCDTMPILRKALYDCETYVGIDELEWEDWNNECGEGRWVQKVNSPEKTAVTEEVIQRTQGR